MTIDELVKEVARTDPDLRVTVFDSTTYETGKPRDRSVVVSVFSSKKGHGSAEDILLTMRQDVVVAVRPGDTSMHWQVEPLARALRSQDVAERVAR